MDIKFKSSKLFILYSFFGQGEGKKVRLIEKEDTNAESII